MIHSLNGRSVRSIKTTFVILFISLLTVGVVQAIGGELIWEDELHIAGGDSSASAVAVDGGKFFVAGFASTNNGDLLVRAYDGKTGTLLWQDQYDRANQPDNALAIAAATGKVFVGGLAANASGGGCDRNSNGDTHRSGDGYSDSNGHTVTNSDDNGNGRFHHDTFSHAVRYTIADASDRNGRTYVPGLSYSHANYPATRCRIPCIFTDCAKMNQPDTVSMHTFVIRLWHEWSLVTPQWRGWVVHLSSGETAAFQEWEQLLAFIQMRNPIDRQPLTHEEESL